MLTGAAAPSFGDAFISSLSLKSRAKFLSKLGYCPQFDGIIGLLSGREMLELFGRLKALKDPEGEATKWLEKVGLSSEGNEECGNYSGGMKRRLSAAMALIGDPAVLLLDEVSYLRLLVCMIVSNFRILVVGYYHLFCSYLCLKITSS